MPKLTTIQVCNAKTGPDDRLKLNGDGSSRPSLATRYVPARLDRKGLVILRSGLKDLDRSGGKTGTLYCMSSQSGSLVTTP